MKRRKRWPRLLHCGLCLLLILLTFFFARLFCGPPKLMTERTALHLAQRRCLRAPSKEYECFETPGMQVFAVWDGSEIQTYYAWWARPGRRGVSQNANGETGLILQRKPLLRTYSTCQFWRDSRETGWGCTGMVLTAWENGDWAHSLPVLVKNSDPAAVSGVLTVSGVNTRLLRTEGANYRMAAEAQRENPWYFSFLLQPEYRKDTWSNTSNLLYAIALGSDTEGDTASAEVVWYDEQGLELGRQQFELIVSEGSEENGA